MGGGGEGEGESTFYRMLIMKSCQNMEGPFSAVSKPIFCEICYFKVFSISTKLVDFESVFQILQDV